MRRLSKAGIVIGALIGLVQCVRFPATNPPVHSDLVAPLEVKSLLRRACYDCHSNETEWPWYSAIAPASWMFHHEVNVGRQRLNLSDWTEYESDPETAAQKLGEIATLVASGDMAPWYYRLLHAGARLSSSQRDLVIGWAKEEAAKHAADASG
jgi:hypothetical protein